MKHALFWWAIVILLIAWLMSEYAHAHDPYYGIKSDGVIDHR